MTKITIILEEHTSDFAAQFLKANRAILNSSDFCVELQCNADQDWTVPLSAATKALVSERSSYQSIRELLKLLPTQPVYAIDSFINRDAATIYYQYSDGLELKLTNPYSSFRRIYHLENIVLIRDEMMAENIITLLQKNKLHKNERNLIVVVGAHHYALVYHLLYKLKTEPLLQEVQIKVLNTYKKQLCQASYHDSEFMPLFHFKELPVPIVEMHDLREGIFKTTYHFDQVLFLQRKPPKFFSAAQWQRFCESYQKLMNLIHQPGGLAEIFFTLMRTIETMQLSSSSHRENAMACKTKLLQLMTTKITATPSLIGAELFTPGARACEIKIEMPVPNRTEAEQYLSLHNLF